MKTLKMQDKKDIFDSVLNAIQSNDVQNLEAHLKEMINEKIGHETYEDQVYIIKDFIDYIRNEVKISRLTIATAIKVAKKTKYPVFILNCGTAVFGTMLDSKQQPETLLKLLGVMPKPKIINHEPELTQLKTSNPVKVNDQVDTGFAHILQKAESPKAFVNDFVKDEMISPEPEPQPEVKNEMQENLNTKLLHEDPKLVEPFANHTPVSSPTLLERITNGIYSVFSNIKDRIRNIYKLFANLVHTENNLPSWKTSDDKPQIESTASLTSGSINTYEYDNSDAQESVTSNNELEIQLNVNLDIDETASSGQSTPLSAQLTTPTPPPLTQPVQNTDVRKEDLAPVSPELNQTETKPDAPKMNKSQQVINRIFKLFTPSKSKNKGKYSLSAVKNMFGRPKKSGKSKS